MPPRIQANVNTRLNQVLITAHRIVGVSVALNDALVDLDRPVGIVLNGKEVYHQTPTRHLGSLLDGVITTGDWSRIDPVIVTLDDPRPRSCAPGGLSGPLNIA